MNDGSDKELDNKVKEKLYKKVDEGKDLDNELDEEEVQ